MASLYDLAMQYLNQSLPETFKYDRTNQPGTLPPVTLPPQDPNAPTARILPMPGGGGDGFSVYNSDPNRTRNESNYNERPYKSTVYNDAFPMMGDPIANQATGALNADGLMSYAGDKPLEGIPGAIAAYAKNSLPGKIIGGGLNALGDMIPVNSRAIYENELLGQGLRLDDIGRIVSDGGNINTAENIMAGYNANKVTAETFQKRRDMINSKMKDPAQKAAKLAALDAAEEKMLGTAKTRADTVFDAKSLAKDPSYVPFDTQLDINNKINQEKELDELLDYTNPNIYNTDSIYTATAPTYLDNYPTTITGPGDGTGITGSVDPAGINSIDSTVYADNNNEGSTSTSGLTYTQGGGKDGSYDFVEQNFTNPGSSYNTGSGYNATGQGGPAGQGTITNPSNYGTGTGNLGDYQMQPSKPEATFEDQSYSSGGGDGGNNNGGKSIVCTAMYQTTGLEDWSKAMKIWYIYQKKYLTIEHQEGYHKLFKPFVKGMHKSKIIKDIGAHVAKHRTKHLKHVMFNSKPSLLGRIYNKILEPICYFVGKYV